jgi:hypothetical protein
MIPPAMMAAFSSRNVLNADDVFGDLQVIGKTGDVVTAVAAYRSDAKKLAYEITAKGSRLEYGGKRYALLASWVGDAIVDDGEGQRVVKAGEKLDPGKVVGVTLGKAGDPHTTWLVRLRQV